MSRLVEQAIHGSIQLGSAQADFADDSLGVDHEDGRKRANVPPGGDWPVLAAVPPVSPGDCPVLNRFEKCLGSGSVLTSSIANGRSLCRDTSCSRGYISRQGPHQLPEKARTITLPR